MSYNGLRVIDFHAHFPVPVPPWESSLQKLTQEVGERRAKILLEQGVAFGREWRAAWGFPPAVKEIPPVEETAPCWIADLDRHGIDRIVFVTGGGNDNLGRIVAMYPDRFVGFAHHNPFEPGAGEELRRCVREHGFRGYKTLAPALDRSITDRAAWPLWEACAELNVPVLIHFGPLGAGGGTMYHQNISPLTLHEVAKCFPDVNFVIPHFGCGYVRELLHLCWGSSNIYVDTSSSQQWTRWMPYELTLKDLLRKFLETIGPERIIFATDSNWLPLGFTERYLADQIRELRYMKVREDDIQLIMGGNAARLLKLPC